jgi:hypothetical protein
MSRVEILWGESRRLVRFGFGTVTGERPMLQDNEGTISTQDQPTGSDIYVSVEMSRSKWVVGIHTSLVEKIGLHTMACGDVNEPCCMEARGDGIRPLAS